jgi:phospholipase/carboxylesterase
MAGLDVVLAGSDSGPAVVLLHGFGASAEDLVPLSQLVPGARFVFPAAPLAIDPSWGGRAWWMIDVMAMQLAIIEGRSGELLTKAPAGLVEARGRIEALLAELDAPRVVLGGFSQGAILALDVALRSARPLAGVVMMSGTIATEDEWRDLMAARRGLSVFQSHGTDDPVLPFAIAERLHGHLTAAGVVVDWAPFAGGHEVPPRVVERLQRYLMTTNVC